LSAVVAPKRVLRLITTVVTGVHLQVAQWGLYCVLC